MARPTPFQRLLMKITASRPGAWIFSRLLHHLDRALLRLSGGRWTVPRLAGLPVVELTATGARSGQRRSVPLIGIPDEERVILIASNWGQPKDPAWYHNVRANPDVTVSADGQAQAYRARILSGPEREAAWDRAVARYPGYAAYRRRAGREIPVVLLEPRTLPSPH